MMVSIEGGEELRRMWRNMKACNVEEDALVPGGLGWRGDGRDQLSGSADGG